MVNSSHKSGQVTKHLIHDLFGRWPETVGWSPSHPKVATTIQQGQDQRVCCPTQARLRVMPRMSQATTVICHQARSVQVWRFLTMILNLILLPTHFNVIWRVFQDHQFLRSTVMLGCRGVSTVLSMCQAKGSHFQQKIAL